MACDVDIIQLTPRFLCTYEPYARSGSAIKPTMRQASQGTK